MPSGTNSLAMCRWHFDEQESGGPVARQARLRRPAWLNVRVEIIREIGLARAVGAPLRVSLFFRLAKTWGHFGRTIVAWCSVIFCKLSKNRRHLNRAYYNLSHPGSPSLQ